jgi:large subunit ribosomal protein L22
MKYSFNINKAPFVFAQKAEINASYKDMSAVCDFIRYKKASAALDAIDRFIAMETPVPYRRHNKRMGARHELGGRKGAYPVKAAREVRNVLANAIANADSKGRSGQDMYVIHAAANKTHIERRYPSKGSLAWGRGMYGRAAMMHSDLEYAKVEIGLADGTENELTRNMRYFIKKNKALQAREEANAKSAEKKQQPSQKSEKKPAKEKAKEKAKIKA